MSTPKARFVTLEELAPRRDEWRLLAENALEANPFYGPDMLLTAIRNGASPMATRLLIVECEGRLTGLFPLQRPILQDIALGLGWSFYRDPLTCLTVPLIAPEGAEETLRAALDALAETGGPPALLLPLLPENKPFAVLLKREAERRDAPLSALASWERPAIARGSTMRAKALQSIDRKRRRLEKQGPLALNRMMSGNPEVAGLLEEFLAMEALSWKGRQGTAIRDIPALEAIVRALAIASTTSPTLLIEALKVGERPVAINLNLAAAGTVYTVKSTYHPDYAAFSPGRLLDAMAFHLVDAHDGAFLHVDSCAGPGHPLADLWPDREDLVCLALALRPAGRLHLKALALGRALSDRIRRWRYRETYTTRETKRAA